MLFFGFFLEINLLGCAKDWISLIEMVLLMLSLFLFELFVVDLVLDIFE